MVEALGGSPVRTQRYDITEFDRASYSILLYSGREHAILPAMITGKEAVPPACAVFLLAVALMFVPAPVGAITSERGISMSRNGAPTAACLNPYIVRRGETVNSIAMKCGTSALNLRQWNRLSSNSVGAGRALIVRVKPATQPTASQVESPPAILRPKSTPVPTGVGWQSAPAKPQSTPRFEPTIAP